MLSLGCRVIPFKKSGKKGDWIICLQGSMHKSTWLLFLTKLIGVVQRTIAPGSCRPDSKLNLLTCHAWTRARTNQTTLLTNVLLSHHWNTFLLMWHFCDRQDCDHFPNHLPVFYFTSLSVLKDDSHLPSRQPQSQVLTSAVYLPQCWLGTEGPAGRECFQCFSVSGDSINVKLLP